MRRELTRYFKALMEPLARGDMRLLAKAGIKQRPFFKSTKGANCLVVYAYQLREKAVLKFKAKDHPSFDQKAAEALEKTGIGVVKFYGTHQLPKGAVYSGKQASFYECKSWAGHDFELSLKASIAALKSVNFDETKERGRLAAKLIGTDMRDVGNLAGRLYGAGLLYTDFKPANIAKTDKVQLFDIHSGNIEPSNSIIEHAQNVSYYLDIVKYTLRTEIEPASGYLWRYSRDCFFEGLKTAGKTKPLVAMLEKLGW